MNLNTVIQYILPHHLCSRIVGKVAHCKIPWVKNLIIHWAIKHYQIDLNEAMESNPTKYCCFNAMFTRQLKPSARPLATESSAIISPNDGKVSQIGRIDNQTLIQAKGFNFTLQSLLGNKLFDRYAQDFTDGDFATLYLSPADYHRVHMPITGILREMVYIPGRIFSVNPATANSVPNLYSRNERVIALFDTACGPVAVILVGAMLVASIETVWQGLITPRPRQIQHWTYPDDQVTLSQGAELGRFQFGSTVILLFPHQAITWNSNLQPGTGLRMGQLLGTTQTLAEK